MLDGNFTGALKIGILLIGLICLLFLVIITFYFIIYQNIGFYIVDIITGKAHIEGIF